MNSGQSDKPESASESPQVRTVKASESGPRIGRLFSQFAILSFAEIVCRFISLLIVVQLARRLGRSGYGRIEFSFNLVYWLIFVLRDGVELVFCREVARRKVLKPCLINAFVSLKFALSCIFWALLCLAIHLLFRNASDRLLICSYGALLLTTALGLDNVFRGRERPGIVAVSLILRSSLYAVSVWFLIPDQSRLMWVPWLLFFSEATGIAVVWLKYSREFGMPRFRFRHASRFGAAVLAQGRSVLGIQIAQVILASIDVVIIGLSDSWNMVGLYGAPHRIITAAVTFGLIFQQVLLPHLIRSGTIQSNNSSQAIRRITRMALLVLVPATLVISISGKWLIQLLFTEEFQLAWPLLTIGIWRVPLLAVTSIHIATLVASHREKEGLGIMLRCVLIALPTVLFFYYWRGLIGMSASMVFVAMLIACLTGQAIYCSPGRGQAAELFRWQHGGRMRINQGTVAVGTALILLTGLLWHFGGSYRIASVESQHVVKMSNAIEINELNQTETNPPYPMEKQASKADGLLR